MELKKNVDFPIVLVGCKNDIKGKIEISKEIESFVEDFNIPCIMNSSKMGENIQETFELILDQMLLPELTYEEWDDLENGNSLIKIKENNTKCLIN